MQVTFNRHFKLNWKLLLYQKTKQLKYTAGYIKWSKVIKNCVAKGILCQTQKNYLGLASQAQVKLTPTREGL